MVSINEKDIAASLTALGTRMLSYDEFMQLVSISVDTGRVINAVEAYELDGDSRYARSDATMSFARDDYDPDRYVSAKRACEYMALCLSTVEDAHEIKYVAWMDPMK